MVAKSGGDSVTRAWCNKVSRRYGGFQSIPWHMCKNPTLLRAVQTSEIWCCPSTGAGSLVKNMMTISSCLLKTRRKNNGWAEFLFKDVFVSSDNVQCTLNVRQWNYDCRIVLIECANICTEQIKDWTTRMRSSRIHRPYLIVSGGQVLHARPSCHTHPLPRMPPRPRMPPWPHMPPTMHAPCHTDPPATHAPLATHAPVNHAHPRPYTPPWT